MEDVLQYKCDQRFEELHQYLMCYYKKDLEQEYSFFITPFLKFWYLDSTIIEQLLQAKRFKFLLEAFGNMLNRGIKNATEEDSVLIEHLNYFVAIRSGIAVGVLLEWIRDKKRLTPEELSLIIIDQMKSDVSRNLFRS